MADADHPDLPQGSPEGAPPQPIPPEDEAGAGASSLSPPDLLDPEQETYSQIRGRAVAMRRAQIGWILIAIPALLIAIMQATLARAPAEPVDPVAGDQAVVEITARALVGINQWAAGAGASGELETELAPAARQNVDPLTTPPGDLVRFATLAGELAGPEAALDMLDAAEAQFEGKTKADQARDRLAMLFAAQDARLDPSKDADLELLELTILEEREALRKLHTTAPPDGEAIDDSAYAEGIRRDIAMLRRIYQDAGPGDVPTDEQQRLRERHGFFGRLALAHQQSDGVDRKFVTARASRTFAVVMVAGVLIFTAFISGLVLFIIAIVLLVKKRVKLRLRWQIKEAMPHHYVFVETMALFLWAFLVVALMGGLLAGMLPFDPSPMLIWLLLPVALWPLVRGVSGRDAMMGLGWHANGNGLAGVGKEMVCGFVGYLAGLPIVVLGLLLTLVLTALSGAAPEHPISQRIDTSFAGYMLLLLTASVWAPLVEETMFRGALLTHTRIWASSLGAAALTGFLFAAIHPQGWAGIPALMGMGIVFALIREWRGSLIGSMTMHALHNGFIMTMLTLALR